MAIVIVNIIMQIMVDCCKLFLPYYIQDMPPLFANRPISDKRKKEIERINDEIIKMRKKGEL